MANPTLLTRPLCENADKNTIPPTDAGTSGLFSEEYGWQEINSLPLASGGKAPNRRDFNGVFALLGGIAYACQRGYTFEWVATLPYLKSCVVVDPLDGNKYNAKNDVAEGGTNPSLDPTNWEIFGTDPNALTREITPAFNTRDVITTSGTYTAPVTGWYKITCIGGGGAGGNGGGQYDSTTGGGLSGTQGGTTSFGAYCSAEGGHSGGGGGVATGGGGGAAGGIAKAYVHLQSNDSITVIVGAGGVAPSSGTTGTRAGQDGTGGSKGGDDTFRAGEGAFSAYGSGNSGCPYVGPVNNYTSQVPTAIGGSNGTAYGGGGGGSIGIPKTNILCLPIYGTAGGANGEASVTITTNTTYPKGGDGGNGAIIIEYFATI